MLQRETICFQIGERMTFQHSSGVATKNVKFHSIFIQQNRQDFFFVGERLKLFFSLQLLHRSATNALQSCKDLQKKEQSFVNIILRLKHVMNERVRMYFI